MKRVWLTAMLLCISCGWARAEKSVYFPDAVLKAAVENALWVWDPTATDMLDLVSLNNIGTFATRHEGIMDLTGLEYATNLQTLNMRLNRVSDITPLAALAELQSIDLSQNTVKDISPLSGLDRLRYLNFHGNQISDLSPLAELTGLQTLVLRINRITDISPLAGLSNLQHLDLYFNDVCDLSALAELDNLQTLVLRQNDIGDLTPLSALSRLEELDLQLNDVEELWPLAGLTNLRYLYLNENKITDISGLFGVTGLKRLDLRDNTLGPDAYCTDLEILMDQNPGIDLRYTPHCEAPSNVVVSRRDAQSPPHISWDKVCNGPLYITHYRVYRGTAANGTPVPLGPWQTATTFDDTTAEPGIYYAYWVQAAPSSQGDNASSLSEATEVSLPHAVVLTLSSTAGGSVTMPGEGSFTASLGQIITLTAEAVDEDLYYFVGWTGTAVEAGKVSDPGSTSTSVVADASCTIKACFATYADLLYVDRAAPGGADANGAAAQPFDSIQKAIDVATDGVTVVVRPGRYRECIDFLGKNIQLTGLDACGSAFPIIDGNDTGPVVSFTHGEDPNCMLIGFVITGGRADEAGAIVCSQSSPIIANCLIVNNRSIRPSGAAVYCTDSQAVFDNCTIADNLGGEEGGGLTLVDSNVTLTNSIVWGNAPCQIACVGTSEPIVTYSNVQGNWPDVGNVDAEPLFALSGLGLDPDDPETGVMSDDPHVFGSPGDYHLMSRAGRWDVEYQIWVEDNVTSPCIDAGNPAAALGVEPLPHGSRINMGAYGGTAHASQSP